MRKILYFLFLALLTACVPSEKKSREYVNQGIEKLYSSRFDESITLFSKAIEANPENFEAYYYRGNAKFNLKEAKGALEDLSKAILLKPAYADAFDSRGNIYAFLGKQDEACKDYLQAEKLGKPNMGDKTRRCR